MHILSAKYRSTLVAVCGPCFADTHSVATTAHHLSSVADVTPGMWDVAGRAARAQLEAPCAQRCRRAAPGAPQCQTAAPAASGISPDLQCNVNTGSSFLCFTARCDLQSHSHVYQYYARARARACTIAQNYVYMLLQALQCQGTSQWNPNVTENRFKGVYPGS